MISPERLKLEA